MKETKREQELKMIGLNIAYHRKLKGMNQSQLADAVNISKTHISNIEAPNIPTSISINTLLDIANILNVDANTLLRFS